MNSLQTLRRRGTALSCIHTDWIAGYFNTNDNPQISHEIDDPHGHWQNIDVEDKNNINVLELIPVLQMIKRNSGLWRNRLVRCYTDNTQVVTAINTGRSSNSNSMDMLRDIFWDSVINNYHLVSSHISGINNASPDLLSRLPIDSSSACLMDLGLCCRSTAAGPGTVGNNRVSMGR